MKEISDKILIIWVLKAEEDLLAAKSLLDMNSEDSFGDIICFHAQQTAEKYLKAFLYFHGHSFEKTHDIDYLVGLCSKIDDDFTSLETENLTEYAVSVRYPDMQLWTEPDEAAEALNAAENIAELVRKKLDINTGKVKKWKTEMVNQSK